MATNTTNFNLSKPATTDTADIAVINSNMDKVDTALQGLGSGLAIISKNNTHAAITAGQYVYVHGHGSLAEGLYTAKSNIAANGTLSGSNLTADTSGGLNAVNSKIDGIEIAANTDLNTLITSGNYYSENASRSATLINSPVTGSGFALEVKAQGGNVDQIAYAGTGTGTTIYIRATSGGSPSSWTWGNWQRIPAGVIDNLASTSTVDALSAAQGKVLNDKMGIQIKQVYYGNDASVSFTVGNGNRHILLIAASGASVESAIVFVSATNAGAVSKGEAYKGSNITSIDTSVNNRVTINWSQTGNRFYFDIPLAGDLMAKV